MRHLAVPAALAALAGLILAASAVVPEAFRHGPVNKVEDFGLYWSAARANLTGQNPYDPDALWPLQQAIEPGREAVQLPWGPPWSLGLLIPFAAADFPAARWAWLFFGLALVLGSATVLWRLAGGSEDRIFYAWVVALAFFPTVTVIAIGQQTVLALAGVVGFVWGQRAGRPALAGALLGLTLAKPQNLVPFWAAVGFVSLLRRDWRTLAGLAAACAALSVLPLVPNPAAFEQYVYAMTHYPPAGWQTPTVGTYLRKAIGVEGLGPAFLALAAGLAWAVWVAWRRRKTWDWFEQAPGLLFACFLTTPYGWVYDQVMLLAAVVPLAAAADARGRTARGTFLAAHLALTAVCLVLNRLKAPEHTFVWFCPAVLALWLAGRRVWDGPATTPRTGS